MFQTIFNTYVQAFKYSYNYLKVSMILSCVSQQGSPCGGNVNGSLTEHDPPLHKLYIGRPKLKYTHCLIEITYNVPCVSWFFILEKSWPILKWLCIVIIITKLKMGWDIL